MSVVCPACGVAVVAGYVRCPKCRAALPSASSNTQRSAVVPGGTAVARRGFPISAVVVALGVAAAIILAFGMRGGSKKTGATLLPPPGPGEVTLPGPQPPVPPPTVAQAPASAGLETAAQNPAAAAADLEGALRRQRLWGRVEITGQRVNIRSGSCGDPAMRPAIEGKQALLHGAGLTKLRCLEQSGAVVFERDL
jgi:hypothetical protein